jgi:hypothetical protein
MSQIFKPTTSGPPPVGFVEFLQGDDGVDVGPNGADVIFVKTLVNPAGTTPFTTVGNAGTNTETWEIQLTQAIASTNASNVGLAAFNSAQFTVDANGFVSITSSLFGQTITGNTGGPLSPTAGNWDILGTAVAAGTTPVTTAGAVSTLTIEVQRSQAIAATDAANVGLAAFNSAQFTVDGNGFVSIIASGFISAVTVDASTPPGTNPVVPNASGLITVTGGQVAAGTTANVIRTDSVSANTYTIEIQRSQAVATSTIGDNGVAHFNSAQFTVDANGFVSANGTGLGETITGNTGGPLSPTAGNWNILGTSVLAGTTPVTTSGTGSTLTIEVQISQAIAATDAANVGLAAFNSAQFTVDANGFVSINGSGVGETITGNTGGALSPTAGNWNIFGAAVAAGTTPVATSGTGSTLTVDVQRSQAIAATNAANVGLAAFNSAQFTVDANGFVSLSGTGAGETITGQSGGALSPTAGNWNIFGNGATSSGTSTTGTNLVTNGSGSTLTISPTEAQFMTNRTVVSTTPYAVLATDYYLAVTTSSTAMTIDLPAAPGTNRLFIIKDLSGNAATNNITLTPSSGTIDGQATYILNSNYQAIQLLFNGTNYEVY